MKRYTEFILFESSKSLEDQWWDAIDNANHQRVKDLICKGIDINIKRKGITMDGSTALILSIHKSNAISRLLLNQPEIEVNEQSIHGRSALMIAVHWEHIDLAHLLLSKPEIDITLKDDDGNNVIERSIYKGNYYIFKDYNIQKKIIENGRDDIILFLDKYDEETGRKYDLVHPNIKKEYPELFNAKKWGLF